MHITPTFKGYLETEMDALLVLQACMDGKLNFVNRRPSDIERPYLIVPGNIFVFRETQSGIKRWTDGISWSPSRISGRFLIYKELNKRAPRLSMNPVTEMDGFDEKSLLPVVYTGFIKKTFSLKMRVSADTSKDNVMETFHIVSYYVESDVKKNVMNKPTKTSLAEEVKINEGLLKLVESLPQGNGKASGTANSSSCSTPSVTSNSSVNSSDIGSPVTVDYSTSTMPNSNKRKYEPSYTESSKKFKQDPRYLTQPSLPATVYGSTISAVPSGMFVPPPKLLPRPSSYKDLDSSPGAVPFQVYSESDIIHLPKPKLNDDGKNNRVLLLPCYDSILTLPFKQNNSTHFAGNATAYENMPQNIYSTTERYLSSINRNNSDSVNLAAPKTNLPHGDLHLPRYIPSLTNEEKPTNQVYMQ